MSKNFQLIKKDFIEGIFSVRTRRFGTIAEYMIKSLIKVEMSKTLDYDLKDDKNNRIEVKFSTVMKQNEFKITEKNVIDQILYSPVEKRIISSDKIETEKFDCNIQQVKPAEFDILYYGLFFEDKIAIFKVLSKDVYNLPNYSNKQHKGNVGEGQFHLNNKTLKYHYDNYFLRWLSYEELYIMFESLK